MSDLLTTPLSIFIISGLIYALLSNAIWRWRENRTHERISPGYKLLRGPGESLRNRISATDDKLFNTLTGVILVPLVVLTSYAGLALFGNRADYEYFSTDTMCVIAPVVLVVELLYCFRLLRLLSMRRDLYLGYFGERVVSESLDTLRAKGAAVFHDLPISTRGKTVNIDHVVVCPAGIYAIETKTRRKGRVRPGHVDGKIIYDGAQLTYPWGEDTYGLSQAMNNALWLEKTIDKTGLPDTPVRPILTFPGWRIEQTDAATTSTVLVFNPSQIPHYLETLPQKLSANQIKHIAQQFETLCRDVEF